MSVIGHGSRWSETKGAKSEGIHKGIFEIKRWREQEHEAGRPSGLEDYFRARGLCFVCQSSGTDPRPTGRDGDTPLFSDCEVCGGTGKITGES
jgi:hypothetical protein